MRPRCGCGKLADVIAYKDIQQPHCKECSWEAAEGVGWFEFYVPADWSEWDERSGRLTAQNQSSR